MLMIHNYIYLFSNPNSLKALSLVSPDVSIWMSKGVFKTNEAETLVRAC